MHAWPPSRTIARKQFHFLRTLGGIGLLLVTGFLAGNATAAHVSTNRLQDWLATRIIAEDLTWRETQTYVEQRIPRLPNHDSVAAWEAYAQPLKARTLDEVVFRGQARAWRKLDTQVEWFNVIHGGPRYEIRKLRYQVIPGLWVPALLYVPLGAANRPPAVLCVNGHDGQGKAADYKQRRCINLVKRGMMVLSTEWFGMGQLRHEDFSHYKMNQIDLCGTSGLALHYLAMSRGLDILLDQPNVDPARVGVTGLSGGGWQTIFISALDPRVTLSNPVAGYSSFRTRAYHTEDLGDSEQTPSDLATLVDYTHLTAFLAPRPALLTFNAADNCCFASGHALPPLLEAARPVYDLYEKSDRLRFHINYIPGTHNFDEDNRRALYRVMIDSFYAGDVAMPLHELAEDEEIRSAAELAVELPADNGTFHTVALSLAESLPRHREFPTAEAAAASWLEEKRTQLSNIVQYRSQPIRAEQVRQETFEGITAKHWKLRAGNDWTIAAVSFTAESAKSVRLLLHDQGKEAACAEAAALLRQGHDVVAIDAFYFGESRILKRDFLYALLLATTGERALGVQAGQINGVLQWIRESQTYEERGVHAVGFRSSLLALVAAALGSDRQAAALEMRRSLGSLRDILSNNWGVNQFPELFCFGMLEHFELPLLTALTAPARVQFEDSPVWPEAEMAETKRFLSLLGGQLEWKNSKP